MTSFRNILGQIWTLNFHKVKLLKFKTFNFDLKFYWNWSFFHYEKIMRFKKWPQLPGAGRTRAGHHHGSHTPTSPEAVLLGKMAYHTKQIRRQCRHYIMERELCWSCICILQMPVEWPASLKITQSVSPLSLFTCVSSQGSTTKAGQLRPAGSSRTAHCQIALVNLASED